MTSKVQFQRSFLEALNREWPTGADDPPGALERDRKKFPPGDPPGQPPPTYSSLRPPGSLERDRKKFPPGDPAGQPPPTYSSIRPPGSLERDRKKFPPGDPPGQPPPTHSSIRPPGCLERDRKKFPPGQGLGVQSLISTGQDESILHNTTGNRFLMPPPNIWGRQRTINKSGYWRVRSVADVKGPWNRGSGVGDKLSYLIKARDSFTGGTLH